MPLFLLLGVLALLAALALRSSSRGQATGGRTALTAIAMWAAMIAVAIVLLTVATLVFGR